MRTRALVRRVVTTVMEILQGELATKWSVVAPALRSLWASPLCSKFGALFSAVRPDYSSR